MGDNSRPVVTFPTQSCPETASRPGVVNPRLMSAAHTGAVRLFVGCCDRDLGRLFHFGPTKLRHSCNSFQRPDGRDKLTSGTAKGVRVSGFLNSDIAGRGGFTDGLVGE